MLTRRRLLAALAAASAAAAAELHVALSGDDGSGDGSAELFLPPSWFEALSPPLW